MSWRQGRPTRSGSSSRSRLRTLGFRGKSTSESDPSLVRKIDVGQLAGNPSHARERLGWTPQVSFEELVRMMVDAQVRKLSP